MVFPWFPIGEIRSSATFSGSCCLWSRLAADGPAAAQQLVADGEGAPEVLELLLEQLQVRVSAASRSKNMWDLQDSMVILWDFMGGS